ncbi:hypothetical protein GSI_08875 [Ganoderma sinense ZZ0214-1]|uniref:F-box domain-containing protein n=1 Tax=Ganoderma sinense ZZ0214-1 TaxID=1077348 RepID=A0A2G8S4Y0_9APHY|nr:hypothetical protein GSI_08875 [Ganoderma sinense ZZ0214-1]
MRNSVIATENSPQESLRPNPRNRAPLILDILNPIFALTKYPDLLSLSLTCSSFRPLAIRIMLRTRPVVLKKVATIPKFRDFLFSDATSRTPHVVALVVDVADSEIHSDPERSEQAIEALVAILRYTSCLKSLELLSSANGRPLAYLDDPRLSAAVGEVASLRELTIGGKTEVTDFIGAVRSPLTKLTLRFLHPRGGLHEWSPTSLGAALASNPPDSALPPSTQFHALRSLTLTNLVAVPHLPLFLDLFPNLDGTVRLTKFIYDIPDLAHQSDSERFNFFRGGREQNSTAQEGRCWTRLKRLVCDVETLFVLSLRCPIGLTMIQECPADADSLERRWNGGLLEPSLGGMIPPEAAATLTHLTLFVEYAYEACPRPASRYIPPASADTRWSDLWRDTLLPAIEHLHALTHFRLAFHCFAREAEEPGRPISEEPLVEDLRPLSGFDFNSVASTIADALPSLQYCFLTNSARVVETKLVYANNLVERWCESRAWRIMPHAPFGDSGIDDPEAVAPADARATQRELLELQDDVAETIIEMEDLDLSMEEKASAMHHNINNTLHTSLC